MSFYKFRQNNSGGSFTFDHKRGLSVHVYVEASSAEEANARAQQDLGIYFDGDGDCPCCGDRWRRVYADDAEASFPETVGGWGWAPDGVAEGYVHFLDGTVKPLPFSGSSLQMA
jgi:hypothetical protein